LPVQLSQILGEQLKAWGTLIARQEKKNSPNRGGGGEGGHPRGGGSGDDGLHVPLGQLPGEADNPSLHDSGGARILKLGIPASKQNARLIIMEATHVLGS